MSAQAFIRNIGDVAVADYTGKLTLGLGSELLRDSILHLLARGNRRIVVNLRGVTHVDSSGLGALVGAYATCEARGCEVKLLHLSARARDLLTITKLVTIFEVFEDEAKAVSSFHHDSGPVPPRGQLYLVRAATAH